MTKEEFIEEYSSCKPNHEQVAQLMNKYNEPIPEDVGKVICLSEKDAFVDEYRLMCFEEIMEADADLHVSFTTKKTIPLIDCGDNDFIVFDLIEKKWMMFNIIDEVSFCVKDTVVELI